ncbi:MAG: hypothetical protein V1701_02330 [Planctomycetota bacterium]
MFERVVSSISDIFTIIASGLAILVLILKWETITTAFKALLYYSSQITLHELKTKIERLNDLNIDDPSQKEKAINIFNEIVGQIRGNEKLKKHCSNILKRLSAYAENPAKLTEPRKRGLISELREKLRYLDVVDFDNLIGG